MDDSRAARAAAHGKRRNGLNYRPRAEGAAISRLDIDAATPPK